MYNFDLFKNKLSLIANLKFDQFRKNLAIRIHQILYLFSLILLINFLNDQFIWLIKQITHFKREYNDTKFNHIWIFKCYSII